jgi:hypothetical protein
MTVFDLPLVRSTESLTGAVKVDSGEVADVIPEEEKAVLKHPSPFFSFLLRRPPSIFLESHIILRLDVHEGAHRVDCSCNLRNLNRMAVPSSVRTSEREKFSDLTYRD